MRGFRDPATLRGKATSAEAVGTWTADWQWVPCTWTHEQCGQLMKDMGYGDVWTPKMTPGIDSITLREAGSLRAKAVKCPHGDPSYCNERKD